jgi:hypothetical protein
MLNPSDLKGKTYADRPTTPLGETTGLTSTPVSERPSPKSTPHPLQITNPYHYQPAMQASRPELTAQRRNSSNYAKACAALAGFTPLTSEQEELSTEEPQMPRPPQRSYSFSAEDLKRSKYEYLMKDEDKDEHPEEGKGPLRSPGIGNSEVKGRDFGFSSTD